MLSNDSFSNPNRDDDDLIWREAEDLIDRLDRRARDFSNLPNFEQEVADSLRKFTRCSGVSIHMRTDYRSLLIAKSGVSVFPTAKPLADQSKRLFVSRSLTQTSVLETEINFDQRPTTQQKRVFSETALALTELLLPFALRREISVLSNAMESLGQNHRLVEAFYAGDSVKETYHSIAKTIATLTNTDRVSIVRSNHRFQRGELNRKSGQLVATSVPTDIDPRARQTQELARLIHDDAARARYVRENEVQQIHVEIVNDDQGQTLAWIVLEQYSSTKRTIDSIECRLSPYQDLTARAIENAVSRDIASPNSIIKTLTEVKPIRWAQIALASTVICLAMWFMKIPMRLSVPGRIAAASVVTKHSPTNGFVTKVHVVDGDQVTSELPLLELHSPELELVAQRLSSELATTATKIDALRSAGGESDTLQRSIKATVLKTEADGIRRQLELVRQQKDSLVLRSSSDGIIRQWNAKESLAGQVVVIGQPLLEIIDPNAGWVVELDIPDDQIGYLLTASSEDLSCSFRVLSSPTKVHQGIVSHIDQVAQLNEAGQSIVRANVSIQADQIDSFRRGANIVAKVDCGQRRAAFVLFRGLVQWWRTQDWF